MHVCMLVFNDLNYDFRVFREASTLASRGHRITVVALESSKPLCEEWNDFEVITIPRAAVGSLRIAYPQFWWRAAKILRKIRADVYHAHDLDALPPASKAAKHYNVPLVYDSHELWTHQSSLVSRPWIRRFWEHLETRLIKQAAHVISVSEPIAKNLVGRYQLDRVTVLRNLPPYREPVSGNCIRDMLTLPPKATILLYQGGFLTDNGLAEQIHAMASVENAHLVLLGGGPTKNDLQREVQLAHVEDRVHFLSRVPFSELHTYTCSADIGMCLIKPTGRSFYWSLPNKLFEYLMAGLPVLASDAPQIAELVQTAGVGECVDVRNVSRISECINHLVADRVKCKQYASAALATAKKMSWDREQTKLIQVYDDLAA